MSDLLPLNATQGERALAQTVARISDVPTPITSVWDPESCPANLLPWLAWAFSVDEWGADWTDDQKRQAIARSVEIHQHKGTIGALKTALSALGVTLTLREWFEQVPQGAPYTFAITLDGSSGGWSQSQLQKLLAVVNATKNLRSHLQAITPTTTAQGGPWLGGATCSGHEITIKFDGDA